MANNTELDPGSGGDTITAVDLSSFSAYPSTGKLGASCLYVSTVVGSAPTPVVNANPMPVGDAGGTLTVDAPVGTPVFVRLSDGSAAIATLPVSLASVPSHAVTNAGTFVVQIDGTALTRLTDIETNTDSLAVVGNGVATTAQRVTIANDSTGIISLTTSTASIGKLAANSGVDIGDVDVASIAAGDNNIGNVDIVTVPTDPFGANADAGSATGSISAKLRFIAATGIPITGTVTVGSHAVTNAGTFPVQAAQSGTWNVGTVTTVSAVTEITNALPAGDNNIGNVDIVTVPADPFGVNADAASATGSISAKLRFIAATGIPITGTVTVGSHAVTNAGTFVVQIDGAALTSLQLLDDAVSGTGFNISQLNGVAVTMGNGASGTGVQRVTIANDSTGILAGVTTVTTVTTCSTVTTLTGSGVAHDGVDSGNPHKIGAKASTSLSGLTLVANADRTDLFAGVDGVQITRPHCNLEDIVTGNASNTDGTSTSVIASSGAGIKTYLTSVILTNTSSSNIYVEIKDGATTKLTIPVPANSGAIFNPPVPIPGTAATAWNFDPSAATTTVYCSAVGFKSKV
jgi:hypothetical protein